MQRGINQLANAIRPTLGPLPRLTINDKNLRTDKPELLDDGAVIARRVVQLRGREADMGAMYLRQFLWQLHENVGDGTGSAAVLFQAIFNHGIRYIVAGGNAARLRHYLEQGARLILDQLVLATSQVSGRGKLSRLASAICADPELGTVLGEIFETIGAYGRFEVRQGRSREVESEFIEGSYWDGGWFSQEVNNNPTLRRADLRQPAVLVSDLEVQDAQDLIPALDAALTLGAPSLLLIVKTISDSAQGLLNLPRNRQRLLVVAAKTPGADVNRIRENLEDLAVLTGATPLIKEKGDSLAVVQAEHLGRARRAWVDKEFLGISGPLGDPAELRQHVANLRVVYEYLEKPEDRKPVLARLGRLYNGTAVLYAGALSPYIVEMRKELAERTAEALRGALRDGVVPGGGVALLDCRPVLEQCYRTAQDPDERAAYHILLQAVEAPARAILQNAGYNPSEALSRAGDRQPGFGYDVLNRQIVDMMKAGIVDSAAVVQAAVRGAIQSASLALTVDVLVHRANPPDASITT
jgi:chaperonin GroEL